MLWLYIRKKKKGHGEEKMKETCTLCIHKKVCGIKNDCFNRCEELGIKWNRNAIAQVCHHYKKARMNRKESECQPRKGVKISDFPHKSKKIRND